MRNADANLSFPRSGTDLMSSVAKRQLFGIGHNSSIEGFQDVLEYLQLSLWLEVSKKTVRSSREDGLKVR